MLYLQVVQPAYSYKFPNSEIPLLQPNHSCESIELALAYVTKGWVDFFLCNKSSSAKITLLKMITTDS